MLTRIEYIAQTKSGIVQRKFPTKEAMLDWMRSIKGTTNENVYQATIVTTTVEVL